MAEMKLALLARVETKPGKEAEVESFLRSASSMVVDEPATLEWLRSKWGHRRSGSLDCLRMRRGGRRTRAGALTPR